MGLDKKEKLLDAAMRAGKTEEVWGYLQEGANINAVFDARPAILEKMFSRGFGAAIEVCLRHPATDKRHPAIGNLMNEFATTEESWGLTTRPLSYTKQTEQLQYWIRVYNDAGIPIDIKNDRSETILHRLFSGYKKITFKNDDENGLSKVLKVFLVKPDELKSLVNTQDSDGNTPLHLLAAMRSDDTDARLNAFRALLEAGADPAVVTNAGKSVIDFCHQHGHARCLDLIKKGVSPPPAKISPAEFFPTLSVVAIIPSKTDVSPAWSMPTPEQVALVEDMPNLGYRVTDIFHFGKRERLLITFNYKSNSDQPVPMDFEDVPAHLLEKATAVFLDKGGVIPPLKTLKVKPVVDGEVGLLP